MAGKARVVVLIKSPILGRNSDILFLLYGTPPIKIKTIEFGREFGPIFFTSILLFVFSPKKSAVFEQGVCFKFELVQRC